MAILQTTVRSRNARIRHVSTIRTSDDCCGSVTKSPGKITDPRILNKTYIASVNGHYESTSGSLGIWVGLKGLTEEFAEDC